MLTKTRILLIIGAIATLLATLAAQPGPDLSRRDGSIRIGFPPWIGFDIILYAERTGLFERHGLDVELIRFDESSDVARALMEGSVELGFTSLGTLVCNHDGTPLDVVLVTNTSSGADGIAAAHGVHTVPDLRGLRVGCKMDAINRLVLAEALEHHGLTLDDVTIVDLSNDAASTQLRQGRIDAAVLWEPKLTVLADEIGGSVIHRTSDLESLVLDVLLARSAFASSNSDEIERVRAVWFDLLDAVEREPDAVFGVCAESLQQPPEGFARAWTGIRPCDRALNARLLGDGFDRTLRDIAAKLDLPAPTPVGAFQSRVGDSE